MVACYGASAEGSSAPLCLSLVDTHSGRRQARERAGQGHGSVQAAGGSPGDPGPMNSAREGTGETPGPGAWGSRCFPGGRPWPAGQRRKQTRAAPTFQLLGQERGLVL